MTSTSPKDAQVEQSITYTPKRRRCLRCQIMFHSEWAGERICGRCKSSNTWRNGAPLRSFSTSSRRS